MTPQKSQIRSLQRTLTVSTLKIISKDNSSISSIINKIITLFPPIGAPTLQLEAQDIIVIEGEKLHLKVPYKAIPTPKMVWQKEMVECQADDRLSVTLEMNDANLELLKCMHADAGTYTIVLTNSLGTVTGTVNVKVIGRIFFSSVDCLYTAKFVNMILSNVIKCFCCLEQMLIFCMTLAGLPGQCKDICSSDITKNSCKISWEMPEDDGGTPIISYTLERREASKKTYIPVMSGNDILTHTVKDLYVNCEYFFRVKAVNKVGAGEYLELRNPVITEEVKRMSCCQIF